MLSCTSRRVPGGAGLTTVIETGNGGPHGGSIQIGIGKHDIGALTTQLEEGTLEVALTGILHQQFADRGRTGEGLAVDIRVAAPDVSPD